MRGGRGGRTVEEVAVGREEEVVEVTIADAEQVRDDAVTRCEHEVVIESQLDI